MTGVQRAALALLWVSTLGATAIVLAVWPRLFDSTPAGVGKLVAARCEGAAQASCAVKALEISAGRHWLEASAPEADRLSVDFELERSQPPATALLLGVGASALAASVERADSRSGWKPVELRETGGGSRRRVVQLAGLEPGDRVRVTLERRVASPESGEGLRVEEVGLFASEDGLLTDARGFRRDVPDRQLYNGILARACLWLACLGTLAAFFVPRAGAWARPVFVLLLTLAATSVELWVVHNPYWYRARDLRVMIASGPVQEGVGANLNYGMYLGSRLLQGQGLTFGPGWVPWERMPGYGLFAALAGLAAGFKTDIFTIGLVSIELHLLFFALANAAFVAAASRVMRPGAAVATGVLVCFMPNQLANTQADSIMVAVYLLTAAALCLYLDRARGGAWPPLRYHLLVHLPFALWFLTRPEGVVGWAALSLILYWRSWRYLALPAVLYLAIGLSWGAYKYRYTGEFSMTTNTVGDNAWIGLWQVPNKFRWQTADPSYFEWARRVGVPATSKHASDTALREVARFTATYPVYAAHLALYRFLQFVDVNVFNGVTRYPHLEHEALRGPAVWSLLAVVALCLLLPHEAQRALFLGWPLVFNLPLFLLFFSDDMRHVAPCSAALIVASVPPLLEASFYRALGRRPRPALAVAATFVAVWFLAHWADQALRASDAWRYWTPFLDPAPFAWYLR